MIEREILSRSVRLAAQLRNESDEALDNLFVEKRILVCLEEAFAQVPDARETFLFAVNQALRFCPNLSVCVPQSAQELIALCDELAVRVHGPGHSVGVADLAGARSFHVAINVGSEVLTGLPSVTINSTGWVARLATAGSGFRRLHWERQPVNALGALAAASLGVGAAFLTMVGHPVPGAAELSLFTHEAGMLGSLTSGPPLPESPLELDAFLVGCGAVGNGWAYAMKRLPVTGRLQAIDRQALRLENLGPYVASGREWLGKPKAEMIRDLLSPRIVVTPRPEEWELFKIRLRFGLTMPPVVVNGLDNVQTRHSVQRLWPETLIDMGAEGLETQVIVKHSKSEGLCLLRALTRPPAEISWAERLARQIGLRVERILNEPTSEITQADIDAAPPDKRPGLERARQQRQLVCGRVTEQNIKLEGHNPDFAPAVPFVTAFTGIVGAAETIKWLMGHRYRYSLHYQRSFRSGRSRPLEMRCDPQCECQAANPKRD